MVAMVLRGEVSGATSEKRNDEVEDVLHRDAGGLVEVGACIGKEVEAEEIEEILDGYAADAVDVGGAASGGVAGGAAGDSVASIGGRGAGAGCGDGAGGAGAAGAGATDFDEEGRGADGQGGLAAERGGGSIQ